MKKSMKMQLKRSYKLIFVKLSVSAILFMGCKSGDLTQIQPSETIMKFEILDQGSHSNFKEKRNIIIYDRKALNEVYDTLNKTIMPVKEVPQIDFSKNVVVISTIGEKVSGGYSIEIDSIQSTHKNQTVYLKEVRPQPGDMVITVLTSPYVIYSFKKEEKKILFEY